MAMPASCARSVGVTTLGAPGVHVLQQPADEVGQQVGAQRPAGAEVAEDPGHVRHAAEHRAAPADGARQSPAAGRRPRSAMSPSTLRLKPVALTTTSASSNSPDVSRMPPSVEALDLIGHHRGLAFADALEQVGVGHEGDALLPGPVARVEVLLDLGLEARAERGAHARQQFLAHDLGLGHAAPRERAPGRTAPCGARSRASIRPGCRAGAACRPARWHCAR